LSYVFVVVFKLLFSHIAQAPDSHPMLFFAADCLLPSSVLQ
jgi:hypothetical protein